MSPTHTDHEAVARSDFDPKQARTAERRLFLAITLFLVVAAAFGMSYDKSVRSMPIVLWRDGRQRNVAHGQIRDGRAIVCSDMDYGATNGPKPYVIKARRLIAPRVIEDFGFDLPGLTFRICRLENSPPVWSMEFSLIPPMIAASILLLFAVRRMRRTASHAQKLPHAGSNRAQG